MPTMITVPIGQRTKSIQFGAAYSPSISFNPDKKLLSGCSGILSGLGITVNTVPNPDQVTVDVGSFIQRGIIVDVVSAQVVEVPASPTFPLYLVAENANEVHNSTVQYLFTTTPAADSAIIAQWTAGPISSPDPTPIHISLCGLKEAIEGVSALVIQRERIIAVAAQTVFTLPGPKAYVLGTNKLFVYRNGKKLEASFDYSEDTPTQFTLAAASILGDILDCIIFQGAPSITGLALLDLTDVTTDLANAIKDVSTLRAATATAANPLATIQDVTDEVAAIDLDSGRMVASAIFTGGNVSPGGGMADVPNGIGFVEIVYSSPAGGTYFFDVDGVSTFGGAFPSDGGIRFSCSVNAVDQGFAIDAPYLYVTSSTSGARAPIRCRMGVTLVAGPNTVRLRYQVTGGIPSVSLQKTAASPVTVALVKRP